MPDDEAEEDENYEEDIAVLRYALSFYSVDEDYMNGGDIPDEVIEMFVEKIVAGKDGFEWYLRFNDPNNGGKQSVHCNVEGTRKSNAKISPFSYTPHRQLLTKRGNKSSKRFVNFA